MADGVRWDATAVSRAITILNYSSENIASRSLTPPSNAGSNEAALATQVERINRVIEKASFCSSTIARGLSAASEAFANTDDQEAASMKTVGEYLNARGPR
jgi:hypothetical protein